MQQGKVRLGSRQVPSRSITGRMRQIVDHAAELFDARGYHEVSMEEIAEAVGIRKPTLYHYVSSKDEILFLIHQEFMQLAMDRHSARRELSIPASVRLESTMGDILELMHTHRGHVRVFFEHFRELPTDYRHEIAGRRVEYQNIVEEVIRSGVESGEFRRVDVKLTSLAVFGMCNWSYQWYRNDGRLSPDQVAHIFWQLLIDGIANTGSARPAALVRPAGREPKPRRIRPRTPSVK
jgi:AcrR family transcriptional regulator